MFIFYLSGLWYHVVFKVHSYVSEEHAVSIFRVQEDWGISPKIC